MTRKDQKRRRLRARAHQEDSRRQRQFRREMREQFDRLSLDDLRSMIEGSAGQLTVDQLSALAAIQVVKTVWRNTIVEYAHGGDGLARIHDGEMFAANVRLTRLVRHRLDPEGTDWFALYEELSDPDLSLGGRPAADLLGHVHFKWLDSLDRGIGGLEAQEERYGAPWLLHALALGAVYECWWGAPWWPACVDAFIEELHESGSALEEQVKAMRDQLVEAPDTISPLVLEELVGAGIGYAAHRGRLRWVASDGGPDATANR